MTLTRAYARAWRYYRDDLSRIIVSVVLVGLTTLASLAQPFVLAILFDYVIKHERPGKLPYRIFARIAPAGVGGQIILLAASFLLFRLLGEAFGLGQGFFKIRIGYNGILRVR